MTAAPPVDIRSALFLRAEKQELEPGELGQIVGAGKTKFSLGEPVMMAFVASNCGSAPATIDYSSGQRYDFFVTTEHGREVWRWSHDKLFTQVLGEETVAPGGNLASVTEIWDQRDNGEELVRPGFYRVQGVVTGCYDIERCRFGSPVITIEVIP